MVPPIQRTLIEERTAVGPLQSALRAASFPQGKLLVGAAACFHSMHRSVSLRCGSAGCRPLRTQKLLAIFIQLTAQFRDIAGGWYPPLRRGASHSTHPLRKSYCGRPSSVRPTACQLPPREAFGGGRQLVPFNAPLCSATLRVGRLPIPTKAKNFYSASSWARRWRAVWEAGVRADLRVTLSLKVRFLHFSSAAAMMRPEAGAQVPFSMKATVRLW